MSNVAETKRSYRYYSELVSDFDSSQLDLTQEDYERGRRFIQGLDMIWDSLGSLKFIGQEHPARLMDKGVMVIKPGHPIQRTVRKWSEWDLYAWTVRPEATESDLLFIAQSIKVVSGNEDSAGYQLEGASPEYPVWGYEGPTGWEFARFNPSEHEIAIVHHNLQIERLR